jgi:hypothetical protein
MLSSTAMPRIASPRDSLLDAVAAGKELMRTIKESRQCQD